jgi:NAD(P)-dependent dehydrogenase (short-subunit alcohol dehydrogenase family)
MNLDLTGKTALVTGSTAGIGLATATGLAECGASVWVNGRTRERVDHARNPVPSTSWTAAMSTSLACTCCTRPRENFRNLLGPVKPLTP